MRDQDPSAPPSASPSCPDYLNPDLGLDQRLGDLLSRLSLSEKISLMPTHQAAVSRLGLGEFFVGGEAAHGLVGQGFATVFPQTIGLSQTWDRDLMREIGTEVGEEARFYYETQGRLGGISLWAPTVDLIRDPRWGRTEEGYGEDPRLSGILAGAYITGMQGSHPFYVRCGATLKHFYANNNETDRVKSSSDIDPALKHDYYLKVYQIPVAQAKVHSVMTSYNEINRLPAILHPDVAKELKGRMGLDGFVVCDGGDLFQTVTEHRFCKTNAQAAALAVKAGVDCLTDDEVAVREALAKAIKLGLICEADLDRCLRNSLSLRFRLGQFDPNGRNPYATPKQCPHYRGEARDLAARAAKSALCLLKNSGILPLLKKPKRVAVIGPLADARYRDWYGGRSQYAKSPLEALVTALPEADIVYSDADPLVRIRSVATGGYLGPRSFADSRLSAEKAIDSGAMSFALRDWGWGNVTLRSPTMDRYLGFNGQWATMEAKEPWGWVVKESFDIEPQGEAKVSLKTWRGDHLRVRPWRNRDKTSKLIQRDKLIGAAADRHGPESLFSIETVRDGVAEAVAKAKESDVAILFLGNYPMLVARECYDRQSLCLPPQQEILLRSCLEAQPNTIIVLVASYPYALGDLAARAPAIIFAPHGGQEAGQAIAQAINGDYSPAGRLSLTWYRSDRDLPSIMDYDIVNRPRTYRYFDGPVLYPFGHGLSYAGFSYGALKLSSDSLSIGQRLRVEVEVHNDSAIDAEEVVQLYLRAKAELRASHPPRLFLVDFERRSIKAGQSEVFGFTVDPDDLSFWDCFHCVDRPMAGHYEILVGASSADIKSRAEFELLAPSPPRILRSWLGADRYDRQQDAKVVERLNGKPSVQTAHGASKATLFYMDVELEVDSVGIQLDFSCRRRSTLGLRVDGAQPQDLTLSPKASPGSQSFPLALGAGRHDFEISLPPGVELYRFCLLPKAGG